MAPSFTSLFASASACADGFLIFVGGDAKAAGAVQKAGHAATPTEMVRTGRTFVAGELDPVQFPSLSAEGPVDDGL